VADQLIIDENEKRRKLSNSTTKLKVPYLNMIAQFLWVRIVTVP